MKAKRLNEASSYQQERNEHEVTISQLRMEMKLSLAGYNEATEQLHRQLQQSQKACKQKEADNEALRSQIRIV